MHHLRDHVRAGRGLHADAAGLHGTTKGPQRLSIATSGTAGPPKVITRTPASWQASFAVNSAAFALGPGVGVAVFGALSQSLALYGILEGAHHGAAVLSLHNQRPDRQRAALALHKTAILYLTPTQLGLLCAAGTAPLTDVRHILVGGGPLSEATAQAAAACCPRARLTQFYGAAETSFITWTDADTPAGSVGRAYPGVDLRLDAGGVIWARSPYLSDGYLDPETALTHSDPDGFMTLEEVGHIDPAGHLFIHGRRSRRVTIADQTVSPEPAEAFLAAALPGAMVVVVPCPDPRRGQRLVAVIAGPAEDDAIATALRACRQRHGPLASPHRARRIAALPLLPAGKPDLRAIADLVAAGA